MKTRLLILALFFIAISPSQGQGLLKKLKEKASQVTDQVIDKKTDEILNGKKNTPTSTTSSNSGTYVDAAGNVHESSGMGTRNKKGEGLMATPPDVLKNLDDSEKAFNANTFGEARLNIQQAILGVEMEIGRNLLAKLPNELDGLTADKEKEKVVSTGWGWEGLSLTKVYQKNDKQLNIQILNSNSIVSSYNTLLSNNAFLAQSNNKLKQVKVKNYRSVIEYNEDKGYKITVPIGQSSVVILEGINYTNEQEMLYAANLIDLEMIKTSLDEK